MMINSKVLLKMKNLKKIFFLGVASKIFVFLLLFSGCNKNNDVSFIAHPEVLSIDQESKEAPDLEMLYKLWCPSMMDYIYYCAPPAFNCFPEVIITPPDKSSADISKIYEYFLECLNQNTINDFFKDPKSGYAELFPYLLKEDGKSFLTYLQEEQYSIYRKFNTIDGINLFLVAPKGLNDDNLLENVVVTLQVKVIEGSL
jgi:hypothetical protein